MINNKWVRGGCVLAAFYMAAIHFFGVEEAVKTHILPAPRHN